MPVNKNTYFGPLILIFCVTCQTSYCSLFVPSEPSDIIEISTESVSPLHQIVKRDIDYSTPFDVSSKIVTRISELDAPHGQLLVHWAGAGLNIIICLAKMLEASDKPSAVFISYDYGQSFMNKTDLFKISHNKYASIDKFYPHKLQTNRIVFSDKTNKVLFITNDFGRSIKSVNLSFEPVNITYYPEDPMVFLVHDTNKTLWITRDFGRTYKTIGLMVESYDWSRKWTDTQSRSLLMLRKEPDSSTLISIDGIENLVIEKDGDAKNSKWQHKIRVLLRNVIRFQVKSDYIFATTMISKSNSELYILGPKDSEFQKSLFDSELGCLAFHVTDVTQDRIMVAAVHTDTLTNLYISEQNDNKTYLFRLSLERIFSYAPGISWKDSWLREKTEEAFVDIHHVRGMKGIYIANQVTASGKQSDIDTSHLSTVITFDWGGEWRPIIPPAYDIHGSPIVCNTTSTRGKCSLHLTQKFSQLYHLTRSVPILSSSSAPGIIMATGTVGSSLKGHTQVYVSRDAGLTWHQVLQDHFLFNMGDHGGILTAVRFFKTTGETNSFLYSTDEGDSWSSYKFHEKSLRVYGLMTEPGETTTVFTVFGSLLEKHAWMIINIDLKNVFSHNCNEDDYKMWSPASSPGVKMACILGQKETFQRRIPHANCFNGRNFDRPIKMESCPCDMEDFECDFGFLRHVLSPDCIRNQSSLNNPYDIPYICTPGAYYNRTKGYRKIYGDTCFGGYEKHYMPDTIPCPYGESRQFLLVAQKGLIYKFNLVDPKPEILPIQGIENVIAIDFDMKNNCVYFADIFTDKIGRQCLNSGKVGIEYLVTNELLSVEGMALDWISNMLYFVDGGRAKIEAIRTDVNHSGRMRSVILDKNVLKKPRGIALHPVAGYMYWTDWANGSASVNRAHLDGSNILRLFKYPTVVWPNGITVDYIAERIYWVDAKLDYIASANLHGKFFRKVIIKNDIHPFYVAVYKDNIYWDDWREKGIFVADKDRGLGVETIVKDKSSLMTLKVFAHGLQEGHNDCSPDVNPCSHICFAQPDGKPPVCACPEGFVSSKGTCLCPDLSRPYPNDTCSQPSKTCNPQQFSCKNSVCVPKTWVCDGVNDCGDFSDEAQCNEGECVPPSLLCKSGECLRSSLICDYKRDCESGDDELNCNYSVCTDKEFTCDNKKCVLQQYRCDGDNDCMDNSDEVNCTQTEPGNKPKNCTERDFQCKTGGVCIPLSWKCDQESDCTDGSDEANCSMDTCHEHKFQCAISHKCILKTWVCDGDLDCGDNDNSDEANCTATHKPPSGSDISPYLCKDWSFRCFNQTDTCIPKWWKCDGVWDCIDGSDEIGCTPPSHPPVSSSTPSPSSPPDSVCPSNKFRCKSGVCIWNYWVCDGHLDCENGEDEEHCVTTGCTEAHQFRCRHSGSCINLSQVCDGVIDCPDAIDEIVCTSDSSTHSPPVADNPSCPEGFFSCDVNKCLPLMSMCDGKMNCLDGTDEGSDCENAERYYQVSHMHVDYHLMNSTALHLYWWIGNYNLHPSTKGNFLYLPSIAEIKKPGEMQTWVNASQWSPNVDYVFTNLKPYTKYNMTVYVKLSNREFVPGKYVSYRTTEGVPSPPLDVKAIQINKQQVVVSWYKPLNPKGALVSYLVNMIPPLPPVVNSVLATRTNKTVDWPYEPGVKYTFWVVAVSGGGKSSSSQNTTVIGREPLAVLDLEATEIGETWAMLKWKVASGNTSVDYIVTVQPDAQPPYPSLPRIIIKQPSHNLTRLAPGINYSVTVQAKNNHFVSASLLNLKTKGKEVSAIPKVDAEVASNTNIKISWTPPPSSNNKESWSYGIYYSVNLIDFYTHSRLTTSGPTAVVSGLDSCTSYMVGVGVTSPFVGPVTMINRPLITFFDQLAAPKDLKVSQDGVDSTIVHITWSSSCPIIPTPIGYIVEIKDEASGKKSGMTLLPSNDTHFRHSVTTSYGGGYEISVRTDRAGSRSCGPVSYRSPVLPIPHQLQLLPVPKNNSLIIYWSEHDVPDNFPSYFYEVLVSEGRDLNSTNSETIKVINPPYIYPKANPNTIYTVAVRLVTAEGFKSRLSEITSTNQGMFLASSSESGTSTIAILLMTFLFLLIISAGVAVIVIRNRRAQAISQRFSIFSHYNSRSPNPTATFTSSDNLEDDDSPAIRGFSDDEPLVVA